jgi:hypothetical protein
MILFAVIVSTEVVGILVTGTWRKAKKDAGVSQGPSKNVV